MAYSLTLRIAAWRHQWVQYVLYHVLTSANLWQMWSAVSPGLVTSIMSTFVWTFSGFILMTPWPSLFRAKKYQRVHMQSKMALTAKLSSNLGVYWISGLIVLLYLCDTVRSKLTYHFDREWPKDLSCEKFPPESSDFKPNNVPNLIMFQKFELKMALRSAFIIKYRRFYRKGTSGQNSFSAHLS